MYLFKQTGRLTWQIRWWANGVKRQTSTGTHDRAKAERVLQAMLQAARGQADEETVERLLRASFPGRKSAGLSLTDASDEYLSHRPANARTKLVLWRWRRFCQWVESHRPGVSTLQAIDAPVTRAFADSLTDVASGTRASIVRACAALYRVVAPLHGIDADPWRSMRLHIEKSTRKGLSAAEVAALLRVTAGEFRLAVLIGAYTGMRYGDVARLHWSEVVDGWVRKAPSKTAERGIRIDVPLHPCILAALPPRTVGYVMPELASRYRFAHREGRFRAACAAAGITRPDVTFHSLRHTMATRLADAGVTEDIRMSILGHTDAETHAGYVHAEAAMRRAIDAMA